MSQHPDYIIERRKVKHARINVSEEKRVKLIIPEDFSQDDISRLLSQKADWINKQQLFFLQELINPVNLQEGQILLLGEAIVPEVDTQNHILLKEWYKEQAKDYILNRLIELSILHKVKYNKVTIRDTKRNGGTVQKKKTSLSTGG